MIINPISLGGNGLLPEIIVTAPSGSTLDLMQGSIVLQTYTLSSSETQHIFIVKNIGTYTIRGTNGSKTKSVDVVIDTFGRYKCTIEYKLYLYNNGDQCESVTGGWLGFGGTYAGTISNNPQFYNTYISMPANYWGNSSVLMANKINRRGYSKIGLSYSISGATNYSSAFMHTISDYTTRDTSYGLEVYGTQDAVTEVSIIKDATIIHGNNDSPLLTEITNQIEDLRVYITHSNNNTQTLKIYKVWLE